MNKARALSRCFFLHSLWGKYASGRFVVKTRATNGSSERKGVSEVGAVLQTVCDLKD